MAAAIVAPKWGEGVKVICGNPIWRDAVNEFERLHAEALRKCLESLEETIGRLNEMTMQAPHEGWWDQVREEVSCLDSIGGVAR